MPDITVSTELNVWRINVELPFGQVGTVQGYIEGVLSQAGTPIARTSPVDGNVNFASTTPINRLVDVTPEVAAAVETLRAAVLTWLPEDVEAARATDEQIAADDRQASAPQTKGKKRA